MTSIELVRGVLATAHCWLKEPAQDKDLWKVYRGAYNAEPFVRLVKDKKGVYRFPEPKLLWGTNLADVGWAVEGQRLVSICAIDNLMKGAAGSALQCLNLMMGWEEGTRLSGSQVCIQSEGWRFSSRRPSRTGKICPLRLIPGTFLIRTEG